MGDRAWKSPAAQQWVSSKIDGLDGSDLLVRKWVSDRSPLLILEEVFISLCESEGLAGIKSSQRGFNLEASNRIVCHIAAEIVS